MLKVHQLSSLLKVFYIRVIGQKVLLLMPMELVKY